MNMEISGIDRHGQAPNNMDVAELSDDDRKQLGRKLRDLRKERHFEQKEIHQKAGISLGTISAIETVKRPVRQESYEKYAAVFDTSVFELLHPNLPPTDPLWIGLNRDHLQIAHKFKDGLTKPRRAVEIILHDPRGEALAEVVIALQDVPTSSLLALLEIIAPRLESALAGMLTRKLEPGELLVLLTQLLETNPAFAEALRELIRDPELREDVWLAIRKSEEKQ